MRIIAGQRRGHKFDGPMAKETRPTSDLVREAIFNILAERIEGALAVDLFAGTGALGLEALSRGADRAIFVEIHRENVNGIRHNLATLRYEDRGRVHGADVFRWARSSLPIAEGPVLAFVDPPYREYENHPERIGQLLEKLVAGLPDGSVIVVEMSKHSDEEILPDLERWDRRRYGGTAVAFREIGATADAEVGDAESSPPTATPTEPA